MQGDSLIFFAKYSPKCFKSGDSVALNKGVSNVYNCHKMGPWFSGRTVLSHGTSGGPIPLGSKLRVDSQDPPFFMSDSHRIPANTERKLY